MSVLRDARKKTYIDKATVPQLADIAVLKVVLFTTCWLFLAEDKRFKYASTAVILVKM